ncbi:MAG: ROK family transcriptional regulator [Calditrichae bacterium]|nr:ROK family transcriptional regulator [Calditrichota bacterium]MCB9058530.1 ROK family transcriptional regulator [Calditrichia bacterium]
MQYKDNIIGGNSKLVRSINRSAILNLIREQQPISRIRISRIMGLNKSTVSNIVNELLDEDLIYEEIVSDQNVGRNPLDLRLKLGSHYVGAINFESKILRIAIADIDGTIRKKEEFDSIENDPEYRVKQAIEKLDELTKNMGITSLVGVGVTVAGLIDPKSGFVIVAPNLDWKNVELGEIFKRYTANTTFYFENDAEASALAELWFGKGEIKKYSSFVFVSIGAGIGTGIVIDYKVIEGRIYAAGEFGHIPIFERGEPCICGYYGCWEAYASDRATVKWYKRSKNIAESNQDITLLDVLEAVNRKDEKAINVIKETGSYIGYGISNIIRALDPQAIVLGGRILQVWDLIYPEILKGLSHRTFFGLEKSVKILPSSLKERPRLIGAATLALKEFFNDYRIIR